MRPRYAIIANPISGSTPVEEKRALLAPAGEVLGAEIYGLDTRSREEFMQCARDLSQDFDVIVAAGGDGTFSDIINAIDSRLHTIAYLPMGSGNAIRWALGYPRAIINCANRILSGRVCEFDLIDCCGKRRGFMASVGFDGKVIRLSHTYRHRGRPGLGAYLRAVFVTYLYGHGHAEARISLDADKMVVQRLLSIVVMKQPYYGYGMKILPRARFDDGMLHIGIFNQGVFRICGVAASAFTIGNHFGTFRTSTALEIRLDRPLVLQIDGDSGWEDYEFSFRVLRGVLRMKV
jgi:diacylglycerol kinase family enzyme